MFDVQSNPNGYVQGVVVEDQRMDDAAAAGATSSSSSSLANQPAFDAAELLNFDFLTGTAQQAPVPIPAPIVARAEAPGPGQSRVTVLFDQVLPTVPGKSLKGVLVEYGPGAATPAHRHAASAFITATVLDGAIP